MTAFSLLTDQALADQLFVVTAEFTFWTLTTRQLAMDGAREFHLARSRCEYLANLEAALNEERLNREIARKNYALN
jgi:hypothetical protein